jgi:trigger factor
MSSGEGLARTLSIKIPAEKVQSEMDQRFEEIRKDVTLKGFRKGKAPMNVIKSQYGDQVKADIVEKLVQNSLNDAVREKDLHVASRPTVTAMDFTDDGGFAYTVELEVVPEVDKVNYDGLELQEEEIKVEDSEVDEMVEHYRKQYSNLRPLDREAREGDIVVADLKKIADPKNALPSDDFPDSQIDLGNPVTVREFKEQLPGLKAGDEKEIEVVYDEDYSDPAFAGARITYLVKVKSVNERILPEVNDEFARATGHAETALELRLKIRQGLLHQKEEEQRRRYRREIVDQLCRLNDFPVPQGALEEYLEGVVEDYKKQGMQFDEKEVKERYRPIGIKTMRWDLLWRKLAEQENIQVSTEDTENWIKGFAAYNGMEVDKAREMLERSGKSQQVRDSVHEDKVLGFLIEKAKKVPAVKK